MEFSGVSFADGLITIDKLQKMCDNDDFLYDEVASKPQGLIALSERTTSYTNTAGPGNDFLFDSLTVTPISANRLFVIYVYIPYYASGSTGVLGSSIIQFMKDGVVIQTGYTDSKFYSGAPHGDHTSFFHGVMDIKPTLSPHIYNIQIVRVTTPGEQILTLSSARPAQFWIEDLGDA